MRRVFKAMQAKQYSNLTFLWLNEEFKQCLTGYGKHTHAYPSSLSVLHIYLLYQPINN